MRAFPIVVAGHVDHGKSTLIGRLLHDTGSLADGQLEQIQAASAGRSDGLEWSFLLDALAVERDLGITLDISQIWFRTALRRYVIIDAPGHREFLKNMISGAASADAALLVVDVTEGVSEQTRRHAFLLHLLGVRQIAVVVNKLDKVDYDAGRFATASNAIAAYLDAIGLAATAIIPASARHGDMIAGRGDAMPWYAGPTVTEALDGFAAGATRQDAPMRLPVQDVYRFDDRRIIVGRLETGRLKVGDEVLLASGRTARIASFETWNGLPKIAAVAGESVAVTLDGPAFVERGGLLAATGAGAPARGDRLGVRLFWFADDRLEAGRRLTLRVGPMEQAVTVSAIERVIDVQTLGDDETGRAVERDGVADVVLAAAAPMALDRLIDNPATGRGVLVDGNRIIAGCVVTRVERSVPALLVPAPSSVSAAERAERHRHRGGVVWLTGLSGAGKSTIAMAAQRRLFEAGAQVHVLDADRVRQGLCRDLGFSPEDRAENVRRIAETARLFAEAGLIVLVAIISPRQADRRIARAIVGDGFLEVHVDASLAVCQARDPKQLYARAISGELRQFTGISAPYETPTDPDLVIDTTDATVDEAADRLVALIREQFAGGG